MGTHWAEEKRGWGVWLGLCGTSDLKDLLMIRRWRWFKDSFV